MALFRDNIITLSDTAQLDAFNRLRVSETFTQMDISQIGSGRADLLTSLLVGGGTATYNVNESVTDMAVITTGDRVVVQSKRYGHYQPGKSLLVEVTGQLDVGTEKARMGYFDDESDKTVDTGGGGFFVEVDNGSAFLVKRSFVTGTQVDTSVPQTSWNIDPLDGTGPSGKTLDLTKANIFVLDGQWLGVGRVRLGFVIDGLICFAHQFLHAGIEGTTYSRSLDYPVRWELISNGGTATMKSICASVMSEGGFNPIGLLGSCNFGVTSTVSDQNTETELLALRAQITSSRVSLNILSVDVAGDSNSSLFVKVYLCDSVSGGSWTAITGNNAEQNRTFTSFSGRLIDSFYVSDRQRQGNKILAKRIFTGGDIAGNPECIVVTGQGIGGNTQTYVSINFQEIL